MANVHLDLVGVVASFIVAFSIIKLNWIILVIILLQQLPSIIYSYKYNRKNYKLTDALMPEQIKATEIGLVFRQFSDLYAVKVSGTTEFFRNMHLNLNKNVADKYNHLNKQMLPFGIMTDVLEIGVRYGINIYYLLQVLAGNMLLGTYTYTISSIAKIGDNIYYFSNGFTRLTGAYPYVSFVYNLLDMKNTHQNGTVRFTGERVEYKFEHVSFKYKGSKRYALKDIDLTIADNDRLALVGENGAGKSTFIKLLLLVHYPTKGIIYLNGIPLEKYDKESLYDAVAIVTQDFSRYPVLTVKQNISVYGKTINPPQTEVQNAAQLADAHEFIMKLPSQYETFLSKKLEGGTELSVGQWKRIAVARQFYANRPLVILDEPTSAIDPIAEAKIFNNLYEHVKDKTVIVVSHRYNTVRAAKRILVFNDGQIIEQGNHSELLKLNGYYAKAFSVQQEKKKL